MVVSQNEMATRVGVDILRQGGNAVDASVAVGFALAVTLPRAGNLGGGGFSLVYRADTGDTKAYDYRSAAPSGLPLDSLTNAAGRVDTSGFQQGPSGAAVPGTLAGLHAIWRQSGALPWPQLLAPAISLARDGVRVTDDLAHALKVGAERFAPYTASRKKYAPEDLSLQAGDVWRQPHLAWSLEQIAQQGPDAFYRGEIAKRIVAAMEDDGGYLRATDLSGYRVRIREPVSTDYRGYLVVSMPPASSGGVTLVQMLNMLSHFDLAGYARGSAKSIHLLAEVMKRAAANRRSHVGDPDYGAVPIADYTAMATAKAMASGIRPEAATPVADIRPVKLPAARLQEHIDPRAISSEGIDTTHFSIVDQWGNAVATTYTLGSSFGSGYVVPDTGILLDDQMKNFYWNQLGHLNRYEPGKRMISTMTPTMLFDRDHSLMLVTGTPGGGRIINIVLQIIVNTVDYGMNIAEASQAPRIHQGWRSATLGIELGISMDTVRLLESMGHEVAVQRTMGSTQSIRVHSGYLAGAADTRRPGARALGLELGNKQSTD